MLQEKKNTSSIRSQWESCSAGMSVLTDMPCYLQVSFLKDRVMAEQVAKDSVEAMLQGDVDNVRAELGMKTVYN